MRPKAHQRHDIAALTGGKLEVAAETVEVSVNRMVGNRGELVGSPDRSNDFCFTVNSRRVGHSRPVGRDGNIRVVSQGSCGQLRENRAPDWSRVLARRMRALCVI